MKYICLIATILLGCLEGSEQIAARGGGGRAGGARAGGAHPYARGYARGAYGAGRTPALGRGYYGGYGGAYYGGGYYYPEDPYYYNYPYPYPQ